MELTEAVHKFIQQPFPLWECELTDILVQNKWIELKAHGINNLNEYSTSRVINNPNLSFDTKFLVSDKIDNEAIYLEVPSLALLESFYPKHGLVAHSLYELEPNKATSKIKSALKSFDLVEPIHTFIKKLVRLIQVLKQEECENDVSYSHPNIPFSIFISVCENDSIIDNLRVAESILHEAMHLKLTLIENIVPLIKPNSTALYYSPWREEERPIRGVLHGLFVFRAIFDFYNQLNHVINPSTATNYVLNRKEQINAEFNLLKDFRHCPELTKEGAILSKNLLPLN